MKEIFLAYNICFWFYSKLAAWLGAENPSITGWIWMTFICYRSGNSILQMSREARVVTAHINYYHLSQLQEWKISVLPMLFQCKSHQDDLA